MYEYLKDHAIKNVWCTPDQDNQLIIKPARITPPGGIIKSYCVMMRTISAPDIFSHWHFYQLGQIHPLILGLLPNTGIWQNFSSACNSNKMICDIYTNTGIELPRFDTWYKFTNDKDLIIAVKKNSKISFDFNNDDVYLRVYTNAFFNLNQPVNVVNTIHTEGIVSRTTNDVLAFQSRFESYLNQPGLVYAFINGIKVSAINLIMMSAGDIGEFIYDSSIKRTVDFKISDLNVFTSILDNKLKYLLHYSGINLNIIDYRDDIDFFIIDKLTSTSHKGLYYHKNKNDSVRMVTHQDYSVSTTYISDYSVTMKDIVSPNRDINTQDLYLRLHIRNSGYIRPLINEHNRITDLYRMSDINILRAMLGIDAVVNNWKAEVLENSNYVKIMDSKCCDITNDMVQDAYGYNSISKIIGDTPQIPYLLAERKVVDLPYGLQFGCTVYEYDANRELTSWNVHPVGSRYVCNSLSTTTIEAFSGKGSSFLTDKKGSDSLPVNIKQGFRVYKNETQSIGVTSDWQDVTGTDKYIIYSDMVKRSDGLTTGNFIVRNEESFLAYDLSLPMISGELRFGLTQQQMINGVLTSTAMEIPFGELNLFLNKKPLINGLDYLVKFPEIAIFNKEYLVNPLSDNQQIHVRFSSYCNSDLTIRKPKDVGFIQHGVLSNNNKFDLRDDRVVRIIVDGKLYSKDDLKFSEFENGVSIVNPINGKPYLIEDIIVPLKWLTNEPTFTIRDRSVIVDKIVSDYLTIKIPQPVRNAVSSITDRYNIFSPFICKIIYDLHDGLLDVSLLPNNYNDTIVQETCAPYLHLLELDPTQQQNSINDNYVLIHPHNLNTVIDLNLYSYIFIQKVVKLFTNNKVTLSPFIRLTPI